MTQNKRIKVDQANDVINQVLVMFLYDQGIPLNEIHVKLQDFQSRMQSISEKLSNEVFNQNQNKNEKSIQLGQDDQVTTQQI